MIIRRSEDFIQTIWDSERYISLAFQKIQNEGTYHINEIYLFDHGEAQVTWLDSRRRARKFDIPNGVQDALSCLYNFRRSSLKIDMNLKMDVHQDEKNYILKVDSIKKQSLRVKGMGRVPTVMVQPSAEHEGMFLRKGNMWVWFTDDNQRIPVMVKVKAPIFGKLTAELIKIEKEVDSEPDVIASEILALSEG